MPALCLRPCPVRVSASLCGVALLFRLRPQSRTFVAGQHHVCELFLAAPSPHPCWQKTGGCRSLVTVAVVSKCGWSRLRRAVCVMCAPDAKDAVGSRVRHCSASACGHISDTVLCRASAHSLAQASGGRVRMRIALCTGSAGDALCLFLCFVILVT